MLSTVRANRLAVWACSKTSVRPKRRMGFAVKTRSYRNEAGLEARPTDRNPSVRQDRSHRRGAETPRKANVETLRALCRLSARIEESDWRRRAGRAFLGCFSHQKGPPAEEAENAEKSGKLGVSATRRWIQCGATGGSRTEKRPPKRRVLR